MWMLSDLLERSATVGSGSQAPRDIHCGRGVGQIPLVLAMDSGQPTDGAGCPQRFHIQKNVSILWKSDKTWNNIRYFLSVKEIPENLVIQILLC